MRTPGRSGTSLCISLTLLMSASASAQVLPPGAVLTQRATGFVFTESPLYDSSGGVYFVDMHPSGQVATNPSRIVRLNLTTGLSSIVDSNSGGANGLFYNASGQIVSCDRERRQISLRSASNVAIVQQALATNFNGTPFNGPNDLAIDSSGGIYFTDPDFENRHALPDAMYYRNSSGTVTQLATGNRPNGVILSPDGDTLYLAFWGSKTIQAYDVVSPGTLANARLFVLLSGNPDGLTIDPAGNIYGAVGNTVRAWNPMGQELFQLALPTGISATNVEIGGPDGKTLFVSGGIALFSVQLNIVPEPASVVLIAVGAIGTAIASRRMKSVRIDSARRRKAPGQQSCNS
jgi:gluconolactonase